MNSFVRRAILAITTCLILNLLYGFIGNFAYALPGHLDYNRYVNTPQPMNALDDTNSVNIIWTAPGDDDSLGRADHYMIRYANEPITESNWDNAIIAPNPPAPSDAGTPQNYTLGGLALGERYYIAIETYDEAGNCSALSNVASLFAPGIMTPIPDGASVDTSNNSATVRAITVETAMPVFYEFAIDSLRTFAHPTTDVDLLADSVADVTFGNLHRSIAYFWHCRAMASDYSDSSAWSAIDSFNIVFTAIEDSRNSLPNEYSLSQSYPNPFNPSTTIEYGLPKAGHIMLEIFDTMGRQVATPINENQDAGYHKVTWNAENLPSGTYFYQIQANGFSQTKKMLLIK